MTQVSIKEATKLVKHVLTAGLVPMLHGSPGTSKSSIAKQIAADANLQLIDVRLGQCDPTDLNGFPQLSEDGSKARYVPMDMFPLEGDKVPEGKRGWLLFLDEFNSAPLAVQAAAYKVVLDKQIGMHNLHPNVHIMCAGNLMTDKAIVTRMGTAMQTRLLHVQVQPNYKEWIEWADSNGIDHRVTAYINFKPDHLEVFNPNHNDMTYRNQRTWHFLSDLIKPIDELNGSHLALVEAAVGSAGAMDFIQYTQIYHDLPSIESIIDDPALDYKDTPNVCFALSGAIGAAFDEENTEQLMQFVERMGMEFQIITVKKAIRRDPTFMQNKFISEWINKSAKALM